jgi:ketosteroid isomerase-like protein
MAAPDDVVDELAIRSLVAHFADVVNRRAYAEVVEIWAPDGIWEVPGFHDAVGPGAIAGRLKGLLEKHEGLVQLVHSGRVWVDGDFALGRWYISELTRGTDGRTRMFAGVYHDEVVRLPIGWRFARRRYDSLLRVEADLESVATPFPAR